MDIGSLKFTAIAPVEQNAAGVKVAVLKGERIKLFFNGGCYDRLGKPEALKVESAVDDAGRCFMRVTPAKKGDGWPMKEREAPSHKGGRPSASCIVISHPFKIEVIHGGEEVVMDWLERGAVIRMPNWELMRQEIARDAAGAEEEGEGKE